MSKEALDITQAILEQDMPPHELALFRSGYYTLVAGWLEYHKMKGLQWDQDAFPFDPDEAWGKVDESFRKTAELAPEETFAMALQYLTLPKGETEKQEFVNQWMRTSGLSLLYLEPIQPLFKAFMEDDKLSGDVREMLLDNIRKGISTFKELHDFHHPQGFSTLQAIIVALLLEKSANPTVRLVCTQARLRAHDPDVQRAAKILGDLPGCEHFQTLLPQQPSPNSII